MDCLYRIHFLCHCNALTEQQRESEQGYVENGKWTHVFQFFDVLICKELA